MGLIKSNILATISQLEEYQSTIENKAGVSLSELSENIATISSDVSIKMLSKIKCYQRSDHNRYSEFIIIETDDNI